jgi:magnesium transporter
MIYAYVPRDGRIERLELGPGDAVPEAALWLDLHQPAIEEKARIEAGLGLALPTHAEMREIEPSNRLYAEGAASYMTATFIAHADGPNPTSDAITFILAGRRLVTLRYTDPRPIDTCAARVTRQVPLPASGVEVLIALLEAFVNRMADILEKVSLDLDGLSQLIFNERSAARRRRAGEGRDLQIVLKGLGRNEDINATVRESLLSLTRLIRFLTQTLDAAAAWDSKEQKARLKQLRNDMASLSEHATFETQKINFLLDATLGMINIEQNRIIKIFSVAAVIFLPPTLAASLYGMNFKHIPELDWEFGYVYALALMVLSAVVPYLLFRRKGWL